MKALDVYTGSCGETTTAYYKELEQLGPIGIVAVNLFRAQKSSARAKVYSRKWKGRSYDKKQWSMDNLCEVLGVHAPALGIGYGWKTDPGTPGFEWVLYVDLPQGQVSFHSPSRGKGPDYPGDWDGKKLSAERICAFCDAVYTGVAAAV